MSDQGQPSVTLWTRTPGSPPEMHRRRGEEGVRLAEKIDRMMWRDIEREFNFKASMRGKAIARKRAMA